MRTSFFAELYRRNPLLTFTGWLHVVALLATIVGYVSDNRVVMNINPWLEPMKLMFSITVYLWSIAWFSRYVRRPRWGIRTVSIVIAVVTPVISACLLLQAGRGAASLFNFLTDFDAVIFQTIVVMSAIGLLMAAVLLSLFSKPSVRLAPAYLWGIRAGLVLFLIGGAISGVMLVNGGYTVGAPDGGPGLPFLNWSTVAGDLRISHGLALHALQILPLLGFAISRWTRVPTTTAKLTVLAAATALYAAAVFFTFRQAIAGVPFI